MSTGSRVASAAVSSVAAVSLCVVLGVAPPAAAAPCTGAVASAMPPSNAVEVPTPGPNQRPTGQRPTGTNDEAPLPRLGQLPRAILDAFIPGSDSVDQQAAVVPAPTPTPTAQPQPQAPAEPAAAPVPVTPTTSLVGWVTGPEGPTESLGRFAISGTDLGIMWDNGTGGQVLMAFGDTYGYCGIRGQQWRYNVLFRSQDRDLNGGIAIADGSLSDQNSGAPLLAQGIAKQIIPTTRWATEQKGMIPTAGIAVGNVQYLNFMSIRSWDADGRWSTNYSAIAASDDNGQNWGIYPGTIRAAAPNAMPQVGYVPGNENFQQGAFVRPGDGYVYSYNTPPGRSGSVYLARVGQGYVPDLTKYEYWSGSQWVATDPAAAAVIVPGPVGELSVQYNTYLKQYLMLYCNGLNDVVARTAPAPQGPWGPEQLLVKSEQIPGGIYAPYLHPWSTGKDLYYTLSLWSAYNVMFMHTVLP